MVKPKFVIDPEIRDYMWAVTKECDDSLERDLVECGGPRDNLIVAEIPDREPFLVDGHRRHRICEAKGLQYEVDVMNFASLDEVKDYMDSLAMSRRNLPPNQLSLVRARMQKRLEARIGAAASMNQVAAEHGVTARTIYRDVELSDAVDRLPPEVKAKAVEKLPRKRVIELADKPLEKQLEALEDRTPTPRRAKPDRHTLAGAMAIAGRSAARIQNELEDVHAVVPDAIRLRSAKAKAKDIGRILDKWGESNG